MENGIRVLVSDICHTVAFVHRTIMYEFITWMAG